MHLAINIVAGFPPGLSFGLLLLLMEYYPMLSSKDADLFFFGMNLATFFFSGLCSKLYEITTTRVMMS